MNKEDVIKRLSNNKQEEDLLYNWLRYLDFSCDLAYIYNNDRTRIYVLSNYIISLDSDKKEIFVEMLLADGKDKFFPSLLSTIDIPIYSAVNYSKLVKSMFGNPLSTMEDIKYFYTLQKSVVETITSKPNYIYMIIKSLKTLKSYNNHLYNEFFDYIKEQESEEIIKKVKQGILENNLGGEQ